MQACGLRPLQPHPAFTAPPQAFKAFRCVDLDLNDGLPGPAVMSADLSITCWGTDGAVTAEYARLRLLAALAIFAYPVCVPAGYIVLFWKVRHAIWSGQPTKLSRSITFLSEECAAPSVHPSALLEGAARLGAHFPPRQVLQPLLLLGVD